MPRKARRARKSAAVSAKKPVSKTAFILGFAVDKPAKQVVAEGKKAGLRFSDKYVYETRASARKRATRNAGRARQPIVLRRVAKVAPAARAQGSAPAKRSGGALGAIGPLDLAYAVSRLVAEGRTTPAEVARLAAERSARISSLQTELAALMGGPVPSAHAIAAAKALVGRAPSGPRRPNRVGTVSTRSDGRRFTTTSKVVAARKVQGQYMGYLRQLPAKDKEQVKAIARDKGVPAAVAELKKRLGKA